MNHLSKEKSPYLLQHAGQPVDWYPWGEEAFQKARRENKPILLSIGYSTCHWCHVMAQESFDNPEVAQALNQSYIAIKVDREERPDIDSIYMQVCQGLTGSGGWPLTILMTGDQTPFYAATYLPAKALLHLLEQVARIWSEDQERLLQTGRKITDWLKQPEPDSEEIEAETLWNQAAAWFVRMYDPTWGGFGSAPKFPSAHNLSFLLRYAQMNDREDCLAIVYQTLKKMAQGGIFDQLGGGFARYSTDRKWLVPHFEKTLYDNALLAMAYSDTDRRVYGIIAQRTLDYVLRELTHEEGGFFCGQDADTDGEEGRFYLFQPDEIQQVLGTDKGREFCQIYQIEPSGIPNQLGDSWDPEALSEERGRLLEYRQKRYSLGLDDKILTSWNGLMIGALAQVGRQQGRSDYIRAAERTAEFIRKNLTKTSGRLWRRWRQGEAAYAGQLSDYANYAYGLLQLYEANHQATYLRRAAETARWIETLFADPAGGYFETAKDAEKLIIRPKETQDNALPSGNSVAAWALVALAQLTAEHEWTTAADRQISYMSRQAAKGAAGYSFFLQAYQLREGRNRQLVCASADDAFAVPNVQEDIAVLVKTPSQEADLGEAAPFTKSYPIPETGELYYYCAGGKCQQPVPSLDQLHNVLKNG